MAVDHFPIEYGHVMMFARAIGDPNPVYHDEEHAAASEVGGIIAPPTFVQASAQFNPDYGLRPKPGLPWHGSGRTPSGARRASGASSSSTSSSSTSSSGASSSDQPRSGGGSGLHAEQHYTYHRPLRVGDVLSTRTRRGESWEKEGRRAGKLVFTETITEYLDQHGELVVTARSVGVRTERPVDT
jgi:acyl dehydratase